MVSRCNENICTNRLTLQRSWECQAPRRSCVFENTWLLSVTTVSTVSWRLLTLDAIAYLACRKSTVLPKCLFPVELCLKSPLKWTLFFDIQHCAPFSRKIESILLTIMEACVFPNFLLRLIWATMFTSPFILNKMEFLLRRRNIFSLVIYLETALFNIGC